MSYVFDALSIYTSVKKGVVVALKGNFTTRLAALNSVTLSGRGSIYTVVVPNTSIHSP